jgi:predicted  nucleic acid-binding Zn-ribbon protein
MSTTNYPSANPYPQPEPKKDYRGLIIALLAIGLLGTWAYLLWSNNKAEQTHVTDQATIAKVTDEKSEIQQNFDDALTRLDSVSGLNNQLEGQLTERSSEISRLKTEIRGILNKKNATAAELSRAKQLIGDLNTKIAGLEQEVTRLTGENAQLNTDLTAEKGKTNQLSSDLSSTTTAKEALEKKVEVASTLNASNISITPVDEKKGGKEKVTSTAKRVDKLTIAFDVDNRIAQSGTTDVYVRVTTPDGKAVNNGMFTTREDGDKSYAFKMPIRYESGKKSHIEYPWKQDDDFQRGNYKIEVYHNGFKIGESTRELKKGGLF